MFDQTRRLTVSGTVARLEWRNPHVYVWLYVPSAAAPDGYERYAFENASPNVLARAGWNKSTLEPGQALTVTYFPLKDGRAGGHFIRGERPDGSTVAGLGGPGVHDRVPLSTACAGDACGAHSAPGPSALPGMTYQSLRDLPALAGWWEFRGELFSAMLERNPPPLQPADLKKLRAARADPDADSDPLRFCRPPQFMGASGDLPVNMEILLTPGRVTITNEGGLIRRIYTDGRQLPADVEPSSAGYSVGRWEGNVLVVETVGIDPEATFPPRAPGGTAIGRHVKITERISLEGDDTLLFDVTIDAPELFTAPDQRLIPFARSAQTDARELSACGRFDRAIDPVTGRQRFDLTTPPDLPPPPAP